MLTKQDAKMAQGLAILSMVMLHLFCRIKDLPYTVSLYIGDTPFVYYLGLFGDICVPIYCFCSGYAQSLLEEREGENYSVNRFKRIWKFILHFWIIVIVFSCVGFLAGKSEVIPGNISVFLGNMFMYRLSYNGAWWFVTTYILLILLTPVLYHVIKRVNPWMIVLFSGVVYFICYVLRSSHVFFNQHEVLYWICNELTLLGTSQFSFVIGMLFYKYNVVANLKKWLKSSVKSYSNILIWGLPIIMFMMHCIEQSVVIAPITGVVTLTCFHLWNKPNYVKRFLSFMGNHSMNIWLVHMFFYQTLFNGMVFKAKYPIVIFIVMISICIGVSYGIDWIEKNIGKLFSLCFGKKLVV